MSLQIVLHCVAVLFLLAAAIALLATIAGDAWRLEKPLHVRFRCASCASRATISEIVIDVERSASSPLPSSDVPTSLITIDPYNDFERSEFKQPNRAQLLALRSFTHCITLFLAMCILMKMNTYRNPQLRLASCFAELIIRRCRERRERIRLQIAG